MKRKVLSFALSVVTLGMLAAPALGAPAEPVLAEAPAPGAAVAEAPPDQNAGERLTAVTELVKKALNLDTSEYAEFYGELNESALAPTWSLMWEGEGVSLRVEATEDGKVLSYHSGGSTAYSSTSNPYAPKFPEGDREKARRAASNFVNRLLSDGETVTMEDQGGDRLGMTSYRFSGDILLNGVPAGMSCSVTVRCKDNTVTSFNRYDLSGSVIGEIPSVQAAVPAGDAGQTLRGTFKLKLEYQLPEDSKRAVLRYRSDEDDEYYVDAQSGELVNLTELREAVDEDGGTYFNTADAPAADMAAMKEESAGGMSAAEQAGAAKLEGVLSREDLDGKARAIKALGLDKYVLSTVNYQVSREEDGKVVAILRYGRQVRGASWRRTVNLDAKTGALESVWSSAWQPDEPEKLTVDASAAKKTAESFLKAQCQGPFGKSELYDSTETLDSKRDLQFSYTYAQKVNGYFFPENTITVDVDATDGSIAAYSKNFDESVTFESPNGILTMDQALDAWLAAYDVKLQYIQVPVAVDYSQPEYMPFEALGIKYLNQLVLGYRTEREDYLAGIDAKTGEPVAPSWMSEDGKLRYSDIEGHWAQAKLEELARYGVGYSGGEYRPNDELTQLDFLVLLLSADGWRFEPSDKIDQIYDAAYSRGLLKKEDRDEKARLTRMDTVRLLLDATGYGPVAQIPGIYQISFDDAQDIPPVDCGYAALAQGLGIVTNRLFQPSEIPTRAQAAVMLYNLLARP